MKTDIFYFTATGNSLNLSIEIAEKLDGKLIPIASIMDCEFINSDADTIGIIFPVYYAFNGCSGIPHIVKRFLKRFVNLSSKYIFAICTHSGMPGTTIENLNKFIKSQGGILAAGFTLKTNNYAPSVIEKLKQSLFHNKIEINNEKGKLKWEKNAAKQRKKIDQICNYIQNIKHGIIETRSFFKKVMLAPFIFLLIKPVFKNRFKKLSGSSHLKFDEMISLADRAFQTNGSCNGCGICVRICPIDNIKMFEERPNWQNHCETCLACYVWCPNEAIYGDIVEYANRYHHPNVIISDMLNKNSKTKWK